ncbi:FadR/GntR family transcriptional regulator [Microlunatus ginsengisoli]|uniref:FadR/GntR family transcriptional regulator n=1 Tax=Microlunatus ginsengisoli TaxID=363863 RepID=A0ABP7AIZ7_9ACTN
MAVTDEAIGKIRDLIRSGGLRPGDRLPPEKELSSSLGLSRNSLREAVKALEMINVLDVRRGDGTYVTSLQPRTAMDAMSFVLELRADETILDLLEVRRILEAAAGAKAAARITPPDLVELRRLLDEVGPESEVEELVANDVAFHRRIADIGGNEFLGDLLDVVAGRTSRVRVWRGITQSGAIERTLGEHALIVAALELADPALVSARLISHVSGVEDWVRGALADDRGATPR